MATEQLPAWRLDETPEGLFLCMGAKTSRVYLFLVDGLVVPWLQGKPIGDHLGLLNVSNIAQTRLDPEDSSSLSSLVERLGQPLGQPLLALGYNEGRSTYFNEPGVYDLVLGSQKPEARAFKRWITHELLPELRRRGSYVLQRAEPGGHAPVFAQITGRPALPAEPSPSTGNKRRRVSQALATRAPDRTLLKTIVLAEKKLTGLKLKSALIMISRWLIAEISGESDESLEHVARTLKAGSLGQNTEVPKANVPLARALTRKWLENERRNWSATVPASDFLRHSNTEQTRASQGFEAVAPEHVVAKEAANQLWIDCMKENGVSCQSPIFFLDAFESSEGFALRSTQALRGAGFVNLFLANPDEGICNAAIQQGVCGFQGSWLQAAAAWSDKQFAGYFLDVCCGDWQYLERQLSKAAELAAKPCVLAITILPRCFQGTSHLVRSWRINDFFRKRGWIPARGDDGQEASSLAYEAVNEKARTKQTVYAQVWATRP